MDISKIETAYELKKQHDSLIDGLSRIKGKDVVRISIGTCSVNSNAGFSIENQKSIKQIQELAIVLLENQINELKERISNL